MVSTYDDRRYLKTDLSTEYAFPQMYSLEGDLAVEREIKDLIGRVETGSVTRKTLVDAIKGAIARVEAAGYTEVWDTEPQTFIAYAVNESICDPQMWQHVSRWDW